jgi:ABC-type Fe3+/spermidine/putrescine transport system ATPase subunit
MNKGAIQQIATTTEIYERPANDFVADFVGESNIFHGTTRAGGIVVLTGGRTLRVARALAVGRKVGVLIRPERFSATAANQFAGEVVEAIYLGSSFKLRLRTEDGFGVIVRQPARGKLPAVGEHVSVGIEPDEIHVFEL